MSADGELQRVVEQRFLGALRGHLAGLRLKVDTDFSEDAFRRQLAELRSDPVYAGFAFDSPEYVLIRLMGRISISVGRRLGEIYDKIPRILAAARFNLTAQQVAVDMDGLELDVGLRFVDLVAHEVAIRDVADTYLPNADPRAGLGIEIRYNFNPNDSA